VLSTEGLLGEGVAIANTLVGYVKSQRYGVFFTTCTVEKLMMRFDDTPRLAVADLTPRTEALSYDDAMHLVRRTTFHPTNALAATYAGQTPAAAVADLMSKSSNIPAPEWAAVPPAQGQDFAEYARLWPELQRWWYRHAVGTPSLRERMVLFWHTHFTADYITVYFAQYLYKQSKLFRDNAVGSYRTLATKTIGDPAMLMYLNGNQSIKGNPNENFGREWFELFTLGIGNYSERDVVEVSRAFTGWRIAGLEGVYNPQLADRDEKTILGATGPWEYPDVVRITLQQEACARFLARKLFRTFVEQNPSAESVDALASIIVKADYDMQLVLTSLLTSKAFFDPAVRGAIIKSPVDLVIGLASQYNMLDVDPRVMLGVMTQLGQEIFYPPSVEGWKGWHSWISSSTFPLRQRFAENLIVGKTATGQSLTDANGQAVAPNPTAFAKSITDADDPRKIVEATCKVMLAVPTTEQQRAVLLEILLSGVPDYEWDIDTPGAAVRVRGLLQAIVRMPEYQLM
jgi:uncharacterized protein (DUF1800 family)